MIVTCPGCSSKYRVRNEAVPAEGARMKCPKCETLFLAKPPSGGHETQQPAQDDPSSMYLQLNPQTQTGPQPIRPQNGAAAPQPPPQPPPQAFVPPPQAAAQGPITALFQAFDASTLPPEAQRPAPAPAPTPAMSPSGLDVSDVPRVKSIPTTAATAATPRPADLPRPAGSPPSMGAVVGSWAAVAVGAVSAVFGLVFFLWTTERADLDGAMMPTFESTFGVEPPVSSTGKGEPTAEALREAAGEATRRGDLAAAVVLWQRVKVRDPADTRAPAAIAKLRADLGDLAEGTP